MEVGFIWCSLLVCLPLVTALNKDCGLENYPCDSDDQCVERSKWCDKKKDCEDGSDEAYCKKAGWIFSDPNYCYEKNETHILCGSGICVPIAAQCDKYKDCEDGKDEESCELPVTTPKEPAKTIVGEHDTESEEETPFSAAITFEAPLEEEITRHYKEHDEAPTTTTSATREVHSSRVNGYFPTSTSYYEKRMKEADSERKTPPTFPKTVPTKVPMAPRSTIPPTTRIYSGNSIRPTTSRTRSTIAPTPKIYISNLSTPTAPRAFPNIAEGRPPISVNLQRSQSTHPPRYKTRQHQTVNQHTNQHLYQPLINHYQLPTNHYQPLSHHYQTSSNNYQSPQNHYQSPINNHQPPPSHYQSPINNHHPPPNYYQPSADNYNEHRPLNGEPDLRFQTNYFKPFSTEAEVKKLFYFAKDYAAIYGRDNSRSVSEGVKWLLRQRSNTTDWGRDTPRAVVALALANNSFLNSNNKDEEIIKRRFMIQLAADLLKNNTKNFNINRMFMAINGLLAVCEDPTDFHGMDLTEILRYKIRENSKKRSYLSPFVFLSLCLSNKSLSSSDIQSLMKQMTRSPNTNERAKDMLSAAIMAFSCYVHQSTSEDSNYRTSLRSTLRDAVVNLLEDVGEDGNFGSVYSTALAAQALMSTNESSNWDAAETMNFLKRQQRDDGSFGDLLATYFVLPALSGRSLLHLRNIPCSPVRRELTPQEIIEFAGPKQFVRYSLYFGYPLVNSQSLFLLVPREINFLDVMRVAEYQDQNFRFAREDSKVYSLSGLPNDPEMGLSWYLYVKPESSPYVHEPNSRERFTGDLRSLLPKSGEHLIFWYHSNELRF